MQPDEDRSTEPPLSYVFAIALSILLALMLLFSSTRLIGLWYGEVLVVLLVRVACLVGLGLGVRQLIRKQRRSVRTICVALGFVWLSVFLEGALMWGDIGWFLGKLAEEPVHGAMTAALLLSIPVVVLLFVEPTRRVLANAERPGRDGSTNYPD